ncbi:MAG: hypothetical protein ACMUIP_17645 [bacterium]
MKKLLSYLILAGFVVFLVSPIKGYAQQTKNQSRLRTQLRTQDRTQLQTQDRTQLRRQLRTQDQAQIDNLEVGTQTKTRTRAQKSTIPK